ncbi:MAG: GatB/YqeY domain-containing protein [Christensenellaceae bacterium]|jgi:uncharacterized protein YqeY|nr:GatB/YqeY domain-containing protein [Christensenellaceae bacterium]
MAIYDKVMAAIADIKANPSGAAVARLVKAEIIKLTVSGSEKKEITDTLVIGAINNYIKVVKEEVEFLPADKKAAKLAEVEFAKSFLPAQISAEEVKAALVAYVAASGIETGNPKAIGILMKFAKEEFNGKFDAQELSKLVQAVALNK